MGGFSRDPVIQEVKDRTEIVEVVGRYVELKRSGSNYKGLCPFHSEKTPSFSVSPTRQSFFCFGCGEGGDVLSFLMKIEGKTFGEVLRETAEAAGVELPESSGPSPQDRTRELLREANEHAAAFFRTRLESAADAAHARDYLRSRGIEQELAERFGLGYAPDSWDALRLFLSSRGVDEDCMTEAGLLVPSKEGRGAYDRFRNRLIFPIIDPSGRVVAFGGRSLGESGGAKYLNTPETELFKKSDTLYGLHAARDTLRKERTALLVEGYTDVISLHRAGFAQAMAALGTSFTSGHCRILRRFGAERVVLGFDGDEAGTKAAQRAMAVLLGEGLEVDMLEMPQGEDPDSLVRSQGREEFGRLLEGATSAFEVTARRLLREAEGVPERISAAAEKLLGLLGSLGDRLRRDLYLRKLADLMGVDEAYLRRRSGVGKGGAADSSRGRGAGPRSREQVSPMARTVLTLVKVLVESPETLADLPDEGFPFLQDEQHVASLLDKARSEIEQVGAVDVNALLAELEGSRLRGRLADMLMREPPYEDEQRGVILADCVNRLQLHSISLELRSLERQIKVAEGEGRYKDAAAMAKDKVNLQKRKAGFFIQHETVS